VLVERYLYAAMEYVPGPTLHNYLAELKDDRDKWAWRASSFVLLAILTAFCTAIHTQEMSLCNLNTTGHG